MARPPWDEVRRFCLGGFQSFQWGLLGFAFARAAMSYCLFFAQIEVGSLVAGLPGDAAALLSGSALVLLMFFGARLSGKGAVPERPTVLAAAVCGAAGASLAWAAGALGAAWAYAASLPFLAAGAGLVQILWCSRYALLPLPSAAVYSLYSMLLAALLTVLTDPYAGGVQTGTLVFLPLLALVLLFVKPAGSDRKGEPSGAAAAESGESLGGAEAVGARAAGVGAGADISWQAARMPMAADKGRPGFARFFVPVVSARLLYALAYNFVLATLAGARGTSDVGSFASTTLAVVAVLAVALVKRDRLDPAPFYRMVLPVSVVGFAVLYFLFDSDASMAASMSFLGFGYKLFDLMYWLMLFKAAQMFPERSGTAVVVGVCATYAGMGAGRAAAAGYAALSGPGGGDFALCAIVCCCVLVVASVLVLPDRLVSRLWAGRAAPQGQGRLQTAGSQVEAGAEAAGAPGELAPAAASSKDGAPHGEPFDAALARLASRCGLSAREAEVLKLLACGRSQPYIAQELGIARGTVHAHVARIYAKVGVNSQDALINAVLDEMGRPAGGAWPGA